jgi:hypothetical protein
MEWEEEIDYSQEPRLRILFLIPGPTSGRSVKSEPTSALFRLVVPACSLKPVSSFFFGDPASVHTDEKAF